MTSKTDMSREAVTHRLKQMEGLWLLGKALRNVKVASKGEKENRGLEIRAAIRNVLFTQWDPISICNKGSVDEYDAYIAPLYRIMVTTRDEDQLVNTLRRIESERLGAEVSDPSRLWSVARALLNLNVRL